MMLLLLSSTQAGPVASAPLAKPLERAIAFVQLVDEMSDRGPRPLLAVFPDGRVASFDGATGRYSVARLTASGVATLLAELEFTARPAAGSRVAGECPSDVGVLQIAVGVTAVPASLPCDIGFGDPILLLSGLTVGPSRPAVFARHAVLARACRLKPSI